MIRTPLLARSEWEAKLRRHGLKPLEGGGPLNATLEWWQAPNGGYPITVPIEKDGSCDFWAIQKICEDIGKPPPKNPFKPVIVN